MVKNSSAKAGDVRDTGLIPGLGISPGEGHCLESLLDRGSWQATVHRVAKSQTRLKRLSMQAPLGASEFESQEVKPWVSAYLMSSPR